VAGDPGGGETGFTNADLIDAAEAGDPERVGGLPVDVDVDRSRFVSRARVVGGYHGDAPRRRTSASDNG
jgi:hypothetical protein